MSSLDRKLLRDLLSLRAQLLAIVLVIAAGVATYVMSTTAYEALRLTQGNFYRDYRLAEVFASLKRAPEGLARRVAEIPGVDRVQTRVAARVTLDVRGYDDPINGLLLSLPGRAELPLNALRLRAGRLAAPDSETEVVLSELFALAHGLRPGDRLAAVINGHRKRLTVVGVAQSPEFVFVIQPGALFPDNRAYGVLWMARRPLAAAYGYQGAFNDLSLTLFPGANTAAALRGLDALLEPYGGLGAYARADQLSHRYLESDLQGLRVMAVMFPVIFLGVAVFLLNVVVSRLVGLQREQIAALKAFGYRNAEVAGHYLKLVALVVLAGVLTGLAGGVWLGRGLGNVYLDVYHFPALDYRLRPVLALAALVVCTAAAVAGTLGAVRRAVRLPPAEAMRPAAPARYRQTWVERLGLGRWLAAPTRMILRNLERRPLKALLAVVGIALSCAILVLGSYQEDAVDFMSTVQFRFAERDDLSVSFVEPTARRALYELQSLDGVRYAEPFRAVPVRLRAGQRSYRTALLGLPHGARLRRLLDAELKVIEPPPGGVLLSEHLGRRLGVGRGDLLDVEVLEAGRQRRRVSVAALVNQYIGVGAYMDLAALNRLLGEGGVISGAALSVADGAERAVLRALKDRPQVAASSVKANAMESFYETMGENLLVFALVNTAFAAVIAFGVVYNNARIALSERGRELASLRVLGFTRAEVAYVLIGELVLLTVAAIPLGFAAGRALCFYLAVSMSSDLYQIPLVTEASSYAFAASVVLAATLASALLLWRRLARLDLVEALKTRE